MSTHFFVLTPEDIHPQVHMIPRVSPWKIHMHLSLVLRQMEAYTIDPILAQFLLEHGFDFNKQFAKGIPYTPGPLKMRKKERKFICEVFIQYTVHTVQGDLSIQIIERECVSVHNLVATILATGKPLVVHNGWIDLLFLYGNFYAPLPPSLGTLMADMSEMFEGGVYDTKAIAQLEVAEEATFLEYLFRKW